MRAGAPSLPARWKPASPSPQPRLRPRGPAPGKPKPRVCPRGRSSPRQVPQGHACPGGCKPQAKVEKGWSFASNPFYTVKTAKLSPSRPLFNWEANRRKTKTNARADFLSLCFSFSMKSPFSGEEGNGSAPTFAPFGVWTGGAPSARGGPDRCLSPPFSPTAWFCTQIQSLHGSPWGQTRRASPIRRFLAGAEGQIDGGAGALGARSSELSPDPGSPVARRGRRRGLGLQSAVWEIPRSPCSLVAFPGGRQTGRHTAPRLSRFSTCREPCGGATPRGGGGLREVGVGVQGAPRVKWAGFRRASVALSR